MNNPHDLIKEYIANRKDRSWWTESEKEILDRYGSVFKFENLENLTEEKFKSFLLIKNNLHWEGIHRQGNIITKDMPKLVNALKILLDEKIPIKDRLDKLFPQRDENLIKGLGKAVVTPILLVAEPSKYGVWNSKSEEALKMLDLFPDFKRGQSFAEKYLALNTILLDLANEHNISLWQLDGILAEIVGKDDFDNLSPEEEVFETKACSEGIEDPYTFGMEKYLENFIVDNWEKLPLSKDYKLIVEEGDILSQQYHTDIGPIDILLKHREKNEYLVVELKRGRSSDIVIGQILRYMGWVKNNIESEPKVKGLIISAEVDEKLKYALSATQDIEIYIYEVDFNLKETSIFYRK